MTDSNLHISSLVKKAVIYGFAGVVASEIVYHSVRWLMAKYFNQTTCTCGCDNCPANKPGKQSDRIYYKVILFPDKQPACLARLKERHGCLDQNCKFSHEENSCSQLIRNLLSANKTIDVCVFTMTSQELGDVILHQANKGVVVRIITDHDQVDVPGSQVGRFREEGILVRCNNAGYFMHHKFVVLDGQTVITGSFNWTRQAITGNNENLIITNNPCLTASYSQEFEKLWQNYKPNNH